MILWLLYDVKWLVIFQIVEHIFDNINTLKKYYFNETTDTFLSVRTDER